MIKEDYVSFETAKLLKEKGFDEPCIGFYNPIDGCFFEASIRESWDYNRHGCINAPTFQMVMKWLREAHNIVIEINMEDYMASENGELQVWYSYTIWTFIRHLDETGLVDSRYDDRAFWQENVKVGQSYEQAVEAAIKYSLENLI